MPTAAAGVAGDFSVDGVAFEVGEEVVETSCLVAAAYHGDVTVGAEGFGAQSGEFQSGGYVRSGDYAALAFGVDAWHGAYFRSGLQKGPE